MTILDTPFFFTNGIVKFEDRQMNKRIIKYRNIFLFSGLILSIIISSHLISVIMQNRENVNKPQSNFLLSNYENRIATPANSDFESAINITANYTVSRL